jgi:gluconokinase
VTGIADGREHRAGISAAMHSILAVSADNTPLTNAMLWMDGRAHAEAEELWSTGLGRVRYERTGTPVHSISPLVKLLWLRRWRPVAEPVRERIRSPA